MKTSLQNYCMSQGLQELLDQWHSEKNNGLVPTEISYGSRQKVWWRCAKGHVWQAAIYTRTGNSTGCPYCSGRSVTAETSLAVQFPVIAAQWHPTRNGAVTPDSLMPGSNRRVWWKCNRGHEWQATVKSRTSGCGCPICTNRKVVVGQNDLATTDPELAKQWHPSKNGSLRADQIQAGSGKKVWWICESGHEWQASILSRSGSGTGCPVCAGKKVVPGINDLASRFPALAEQWHREKNGALTPQMVSVNSNRRVWWQCEKGHEWQVAISRRATGNTGCPFCTGRKPLAGFNDLATLEPKIAEQWHPELNGTLSPDSVTVGSHKKVWWQCDQGHSWKAVVFSRTGAQKCGCPVCAGKVKSGTRNPTAEAVFI